MLRIFCPAEEPFQRTAFPRSRPGGAAVPQVESSLSFSWPEVDLERKKGLVKAVETFEPFVSNY
jgi:hypothetical protein